VATLRGAKITPALVRAAVATFTSLAAAAVAAKELSRVTEPTGASQSARAAPNRRVIHTPNDGRLAVVVDARDDANRRPRAFIVRAKDRRPLGCAFREFIGCFRATGAPQSSTDDSQGV
jgi:hypothetical protein